MNDPKQLDTRRKELTARLRHDPSAPPAAPAYTKEEMAAAAQRLMAHVLKNGKLVS